MDNRLNTPFWALRISLGLVAFLAGLDKFFNLLTDWTEYLAPQVSSLVPLSAPTMMGIAGVIEMVAGVLLLAGITRIGGYVVMGWLLLIALSLIVSGRFLDVAVRVLAMAVGAYTLARLSEVRADSKERSHSHSDFRGTVAEA